MKDFEQAAYEPTHHNHTERTTEALQQRITELSTNSRLIGYTGLRAVQVASEMNIIAFELAERHREELEQEIEEAWAGRDAVMEVLE